MQPLVKLGFPALERLQAALRLFAIKLPLCLPCLQETVYADGVLSVDLYGINRSFQNIGLRDFFLRTVKAGIQPFHDAAVGAVLLIVPLHGMTAYAADHLALQRIPAAGCSFIFPVLPHTSLRFLEQRLRHNGFMPVGDNDPVIAGDFDRVRTAYNIPASFAVHRLSNIPLVPQELCDQTGRPEVFLLNTAPRRSCAACLDLVVLWRAYALTVQSRRDLPCFCTIRCHLKDAPYHLGGFGIYQKMIFVFWVFDVSIRRIGTEKCPALGPCFFCVFDPAGEVTAIQVVDQRPKRGIEAVDIQRIAAVKAVVDGNEAHTQEREHAGDVVSNGEVITAKAG